MRSLVLWACALITLLPGCSYDCNASNCADGCCGANGVCYVGGTDESCGLGGAACQDCSAAGQICGRGKCGLKCVEGLACEKKADCCDELICWEKSCAPCRWRGESCASSEECCGHDPTNIDSRRCWPTNGNTYLPWICQ